MPEQNVNIGAFKIMLYVYPMWNTGSTAVIEISAIGDFL